LTDLEVVLDVQDRIDGGTPKRMTGASKGFQKAMQKANVVEDTAEELIK
jgi:hypothetical protein